MEFSDYIVYADESGDHRLTSIDSQFPVFVLAFCLVRKLEPADPYEIALVFCMERLQRYLINRGQAERTTHVQVECRGKAEDAKLELEFRQICDGKNIIGKMPNLDIRFMNKNHNSTGLQLADLVAQPIGRHVINPNQPNRAYDILEPKFRRGPAGLVKGFGLKIFP